MIVTETRAELTAALGGRSSDGSVALVPTMGALHEGHASLLDVGRRHAQRLVVSVFVNPLQFAAGEDLTRYPRSLDADLALCEAHGADVVFAPTVDVVYPGGEPQVTVDPGPRGAILEGAVRPGHFAGVLTVVAKLFGLVQPDVAVFGEKDFQQVALVTQLVRDLCMPVEIIAAATVRTPDGLALSSRNRYLSDAERTLALTLSRALAAGRAAGAEGQAAVLAAARAVYDREPAVVPDYVSLRGEDLGEAPSTGRARLLTAARIGSTRLIDNTAVELLPVDSGGALRTGLAGAAAVRSS